MSIVIKHSIYIQVAIIAFVTTTSFGEEFTLLFYQKGGGKREREGEKEKVHDRDNSERSKNYLRRNTEEYIGVLLWCGVSLLRQFPSASAFDFGFSVLCIPASTGVL